MTCEEYEELLATLERLLNEDGDAWTVGDLKVFLAMRIEELSNESDD